MLNIHREALGENQYHALEKLADFPGGYILGGGTAVALQIGHRRSYDLDFFSEKRIQRNLFEKLLHIFGKERIKPLVDNGSELSVLVSREVKISFIYFPFPPLHDIVRAEGVKLFSLLDLASNKAYVIGRRGAWRDYVDLFFLIKRQFSLADVIVDAKKRFGESFNEKLFLEQLVYTEDINDFTVEYIGTAHSSTPGKITKFFEMEARKITRFSK